MDVETKTLLNAVADGRIKNQRDQYRVLTNALRELEADVHALEVIQDQQSGDSHHQGINHPS